MIERALIELDETTHNRTEPLSIYQSDQVCLLINSYYINICGSMDNLAWALLYKLNPKNIDENNCDHRKLATLSNLTFKNQLKSNGLIKLTESLNNLQDWIADLKKFRDPSAHRIPLIISPSILSKIDLAKYTDLDQEAADLISNGRRSEGMEKFYEKCSLGTFSPIFICENPEFAAYPIIGQLNHDHTHWLKAVFSVLDHGFTLA